MYPHDNPQIAHTGFSSLYVAAGQGDHLVDMSAHHNSPRLRFLFLQMQKLKGITFVELLPCDDPDTDIMHVITEPDLSAYVPKSLNRFITFDPAVHDHVTYVRDKVAGPTYEWSVDEHLPSLGDSVRGAGVYNHRHLRSSSHSLATATKCTCSHSMTSNASSMQKGRLPLKSA